MPRPIAALLIVVAVRYVVRAVIGRRVALVVQVGRVESDVDGMTNPNQCHCCEKKYLIHLPREILNDSNFKKIDPPIRVCPDCDGEAMIENALNTHEKRLGKSEPPKA